MKELLVRFFDIRSGEWQRVAMIFTLTLSMGIAFVLLESTAESFFLKSLGSRLIPYIMIPTSLLRFASGIIYAAYADRIRHDTVYIFLFSLGSTLLAASWFLTITIADSTLPYGSLIAFGSLFVLYHMLFNLSIMHVNAYINGLFDILESKRLFPLVLTGWRVGFIIGGFGLGLTLDLLGISNLILVVIAFMIFNIFLIYTIRLRVGRQDAGSRASVGLRKLGIRESYKQGLNFIRNSSLLKTGAVGAFLMVIFLEIQYFQYNTIFEKEFTSEEDLVRFFALFAGISNIIGLFMQAVLVPRLVKWLGVSSSNLIFPTLSLLATISLFSPYLMPAVFSRFNHKTIKEAIKRPTTFMVYNPVPTEMRGRAEAFIKGFVLPIGVLTASGLLIVCQKINLSPIQISLVAFILSIGYLFITYKQNNAYVKTLVSILHQKSVDLHSLAPGEFGRVSDKELAPLIGSLQDPDEHIAVFAAEVLGRVGGRRAIKPILTAITNKTATTQSAFIRILGDIRDPSTIEPLTEFLAHKDSRVRADTIEALGKLDDARVVGLVKKHIFDPNNRVQANSVIVLARCGDDEIAMLGTSILEEMLISDDPQMRSSAIFAMGELAQPEKRKQITRISKYLRDPADIVRYQTCSSLRRLVREPDKEISDELCLLLDDKVRKVRLIVAETINGIATVDCIEPLKKCLIDPALKIRRNVSETLVKIGEPAFEHLLPQLRSIEIIVPMKEQVVVILRQINIEKARTEFLLLAQRELRTAYANCTLISVLKQCESSRAVELLIKAVEDKNIEILSLCLRILESLGNPETIKVIERGLKYMDARSKASAIETLEHVGDKRIIRLLIPLLDNVPFDERAEIALQTWNIKKRSLLSVIRHFVGSRDPWLRACALYAIGEVKILDFGQYVIRNINDADHYVREAAIEAMEKLDITPETFKTNGPRIQYI